MFSRIVRSAARASRTVVQQPAARTTFVRRAAFGTGMVGVSAFAMTASASADAPAAVNYGEVRKAIAEILDQMDHDDGSLGPIFLRLGWHASGSYSKEDGTGGSNGGTMRFDPEANIGANAGLGLARDALEVVKKEFPGISYGDLWTLASVVAIEEMGGPVIPWRPGRTDAADGSACPPDGRLPDAEQGAQHLRDIFYRMGLSDQDIVALSGAHTFGRCHTGSSGFDGPWTFAPTTFSNLYFTELLGRKWQVRDWKGPLQYENADGGELMMLPTDVCLLEDPSFRKWVDIYAADEERFAKDFSDVFCRLTELGVPFEKDNSTTAYLAIATLVALALKSGA